MAKYQVTYNVLYPVSGERVRNNAQVVVEVDVKRGQNIKAESWAAAYKLFNCDKPVYRSLSCGGHWNYTIDDKPVSIKKLDTLRAKVSKSKRSGV